MAKAITTNLSIIFTRVREITVTDDELSIITKNSLDN